MTGIPELETERLRLRDWRDEDLDPYAALCADAEVMRWLHGPLRREESIGQVGAIREHWATVDFAFGPLALHRIVSITQLPNRASRRVMEKLGMAPERTTVHPEHGHDVIVYELLAPGAR